MTENTDGTEPAARIDDDLRVVFVLASTLAVIVLAGYIAGAIATGALGMFAGIALLVVTGVAFSISSVVVG